jgi:hypothetical protein
MNKSMVGLIVAAGIVLGSGGAAMAAEVNGNGDPVPGAHNAHSECAFSGLDTADALEMNPPGFDDDAIAVRGNQSPAGVDRYHGVQSYGTIVRAGGKATAPSPGMACRGDQ